MFNLPNELWDLYYDENYQKLIHQCTSELKNENLDRHQKIILQGLLHYGQACDSWEKSYNYSSILSDLQISIDSWKNVADQSEKTNKIFIEGLITMSKINQVAVQIENAMIFNDATKMKEFSFQGIDIVNDYMDGVSQEEDNLEDIVELVISYRDYIKSYGQYAEVIELYRNGDDYQQKYEETIEFLKNTSQEMIENDDRITSSEIKGLLANLAYSYPLWKENKSKIVIEKSNHKLSSSFYVSSGFSDHLIENVSKLSSEQISSKIFESTIKIRSAGIDGLDDFLQTSIGEEYGDLFHILLPSGNIQLKNRDIEFEVHLYIRRFGTAMIVYDIDLENIDPSDFRMIQTLVGPQVGITEINFNQNKFSRLDEISKTIYQLLLNYHNSWIQEDDLLDVLRMDSAPYDSDRTWFARSVIYEVSLIESESELRTKIQDYRQLVENYQFKALIAPLVEGRPSLDDWIQIPELEIDNLASIRLHADDLIIFDTHTLLVFLPSKPDFILQGVLSTAALVNDISTLINGFDVMAERVRSSLIHQVKHAKLMLEQVEIDKIKSDLKVLRRNVIEVTEFELLALQSVQLLKSQSTIKYPDHAKFLLALIDKSTISSTIESLEQKISIIKESQEGILRTADDLVAKYQEEVSESQQRLVRVITLIGAGVAQITIIDDILAVFQNQQWITEGSAETIKLAVIILAFVFSGIAISWLGLGYLRSKKNLFE